MIHPGRIFGNYYFSVTAKKLSSDDEKMGAFPRNIMVAEELEGNKIRTNMKN